MRCQFLIKLIQVILVVRNFKNFVYVCSVKYFGNRNGSILSFLDELKQAKLRFQVKDSDLLVFLPEILFNGALIWFKSKTILNKLRFVLL